VTLTLAPIPPAVCRRIFDPCPDLTALRVPAHVAPIVTLRR